MSCERSAEIEFKRASQLTSAVGRAVAEAAKSKKVAKTAPAICFQEAMVGLVVKCERY